MAAVCIADLVSFLWIIGTDAVAGAGCGRGLSLIWKNAIASNG
jgi:hypothetical protein